VPAAAVVFPVTKIGVRCDRNNVGCGAISYKRGNLTKISLNHLDIMF
jgi:hypothetical protein